MSRPAALRLPTVTRSSTPSQAPVGALVMGEYLRTADPLAPKCQSWVAEFSQALGPYVNGAYVNVPNAGMAGWETAYWGPNVDRLRTIKAKYDPRTCSASNRAFHRCMTAGDSGRDAAEGWFLDRGLPAALTPRARSCSPQPRSSPA